MPVYLTCTEVHQAVVLFYPPLTLPDVHKVKELIIQKIQQPLQNHPNNHILSYWWALIHFHESRLVCKIKISPGTAQREHNDMDVGSGCTFSSKDLRYLLSAVIYWVYNPYTVLCYLFRPDELVCKSKWNVASPMFPRGDDLSMWFFVVCS